MPPTKFCVEYSFPSNIAPPDGTGIPTADQLQEALRGGAAEKVDSTISPLYSVVVKGADE